MAYELGIERFGTVDVVRALDDRSSVGENREIMAIRCETEHELVVVHRALSCRHQHLGQGGKVKLATGSMGNLDGISATERGGVGTHLAFQPLEVPLLAARTVNLVLKLADLEATEFVIPDIDVNQLSVDGFNVTSHDLDGFGGLQAGNHIDGR